MSNAAAWVPYLVGTVLFYGLAQALTKQFMANLSAAAFIVLYVLVKGVINTGAFFALGHAPLFDSAANTFIALAVCGNLINGFAWLFYYKALESGKVSLVGSITAGYPALTVILAILFLHEHIVWYQALGIVMVIGSGVLVALGPQEAGADAGPPDRRWLVYSLLVFLGWGIFSAFIKGAFNAPHADTYTFFIWNAIGAAVILGPYGFWGVRKEGGLGPTNEVLKALIPTALFALGDLALFKAFEAGPATIVAPLSTVYPLVTLLYAAPVLKERISLTQWLAVMLLIAGIVVVSLPSGA
ncbi:MAG: integral rane protein [Cyanobacteria bacterium RYN_339]|nr:integral rane protein [Cyanobacteria bacterium RYN_339]